MADQQETVIIDVSINAADAKQRAEALVKAIRDLNDAQTILKATGQKNSVQFRENAQMLRQMESEVKAYINITKQADGSINSMRAQIAILTNQYNALSKAERETTKEGKLL